MPGGPDLSEMARQFVENHGTSPRVVFEELGIPQIVALWMSETEEGWNSNPSDDEVLAAMQRSAARKRKELEEAIP